MAFSLKKWLKDDDNDIFANDGNNDTYYNKTPEEAATIDNGKGKMILMEPRAYSESQQIVDHLKARNTVVVNLKRVTSDQAKRIVDFLSGTIYAISGDLQKLGGGIFLCTPNSVNVEGKISDEGLKGKDGKTSNKNKTEENKEEDDEYNW